MVPDQVIDTEVLMDHSVSPEDGSEPLVGPFNTFSVPLLCSSPEGGLVDAGEEVRFLAIDMSLPGISGLLQPYPEDGEDTDLINHFAHFDSSARPSFPEALAQIRQWLDEQAVDRAGFYTAMEEEEQIPPTSPKAATKARGSVPGSTMPAKAGAAPKARKHTVASLAEQVEVLMGALPEISEQLAALAKRTEEQQQQHGQPQQENPRPKTSKQQPPGPPSHFQTSGRSQGRDAGLCFSGRPSMHRLLQTECISRAPSHCQTSPSKCRPDTTGADLRGGRAFRPSPNGRGRQHWLSHGPGIAAAGQSPTGHHVPFPQYKHRSYVRPVVFYTHHGNQGKGGQNAQVSEEDRAV